MQNGGLSSILNNYNFLSGGGITNPNAVAALAGASGSSLLKSNNLYPSLNKSQISSLWGNGPSAGLMGSIPRGPYGNFSGNQVQWKLDLRNIVAKQNFLVVWFKKDFLRHNVQFKKEKFSKM